MYICFLRCFLKQTNTTAAASTDGRIIQFGISGTEREDDGVGVGVMLGAGDGVGIGVMLGLNVGVGEALGLEWVLANWVG